MSILDRVAANNQWPVAYADRLWSIAAILGATELVWESREIVLGQSGFRKPWIESANLLSAKFAELVVELALWSYRQNVPATDRATRALDLVLYQHGDAAAAAMLILGRYAPQIRLVAPLWFGAATASLFDGGAEDPERHPAWAGYITTASLFNPVFTELRPWYVQHANVAATVAGEPHPPHPAEGLAEHVLIAFLRGLVALGDTDGLVEATFRNVPVSARQHAYWSLFRGWSNAEERPPEAMTGRAVALWEWRLTDLETNPTADASAEEGDALIWLFMTPWIAAEDAVRLGRHTFALAGGEHRTTHGAWERMAELAVEHPIGTLDLVEIVVRKELSAKWSHLAADAIGPSLRPALLHPDRAVRERAVRLVEELAERTGDKRFLELLKE